MDKLELISALVENHKAVMFETERFIWKNPQLGFKEWKAHEYLTARLAQMGLDIMEAGDIPGFYVDIDTGRPGPTLCILGELDALPVPDHPESDKDTGAVHACGHNCQAAALIGIAGALSDKRVLDGLCGKIRVMAVPAEELVDMDYRINLREKGVIKYLNGKTEFLRRGFFDGVDMSVYIHTTSITSQKRPEFYMEKGTSGIILKHVIYTGKTTGERANALYAATTAISAINSIREKYIGADMFTTHTIITEGGQGVNVIPTKAVLQNDVRAASYELMKSADEQINRAFVAGALAMGAQVRIVGDDTYLPSYGCDKLDDMMCDIAERILSGNSVIRDNLRGVGGSDFGNISTIIPTTYGYMNGATGRAHGTDYHITHPEWAVAESARLQAVFACELLSGEGEKFRAVTENYRPMFPSASSLMQAIDSTIIDRECIEYGDGNASVGWINRR